MVYAAKVKFIHTSNIHLDRCFSDLGCRSSTADVLRKGIQDGFERLVSFALANDIDLLLVAGDLFDNRQLCERTKSFLIDQCARLRSGNVRMVVAPGKIDEFADRRWYFPLELGENVTVFERSRNVVLFPDLAVRIIGCPHPLPRTLELDLKPDSDTFTILLQYLPKIKGRRRSWLMNMISRYGIDYIALGGRLAEEEYFLTPEWTAFYPGSPTIQTFAQSGGSVIVGIFQDGELKINRNAGQYPHPVEVVYDLPKDGQNYDGNTFELLVGCEDLIIKQYGNCLVRVKFRGIRTSTWNLDRWTEKMREKVPGLVVVDDTVIDPDQLLDRSEYSMRSLFIEELGTLIKKEPDGQRKRTLSMALEEGLRSFGSSDR